MRALASLGGAVVIGASVFAVRHHVDALPFYLDASRTPEWIAPADARYPAIHTVGDFALVDEQGAPVTRASFDGKITVVSFFYTDCKDLCPKLRSNLAAVQAAFARDSNVVILSHSVNPMRDDTAALRRYAQVNHLVPGKWRLLTGPDATMRDLMAHSYFVALPNEVDGLAVTARHSETVVLVDGEHRVRGMYDGSLPFDVERLIDDVRKLQ